MSIHKMTNTCGLDFKLYLFFTLFVFLLQSSPETLSKQCQSNYKSWLKFQRRDEIVAQANSGFNILRNMKNLDICINGPLLIYTDIQTNTNLGYFSYTGVKFSVFNSDCISLNGDGVIVSFGSKTVRKRSISDVGSMVIPRVHDGNESHSQSIIPNNANHEHSSVLVQVPQSQNMIPIPMRVNAHDKDLDSNPDPTINHLFHESPDQQALIDDYGKLPDKDYLTSPLDPTFRVTNRKEFYRDKSSEETHRKINNLHSNNTVQKQHPKEAVDTKAYVLSPSEPGFEEQAVKKIYTHTLPDPSTHDKDKHIFPKNNGIPLNGLTLNSPVHKDHSPGDVHLLYNNRTRLGDSNKSDFVDPDFGIFPKHLDGSQWVNGAGDDKITTTGEVGTVNLKALKSDSVEDNLATVSDFSFPHPVIGDKVYGVYLIGNEADFRQSQVTSFVGPKFEYRIAFRSNDKTKLTYGAESSITINSKMLDCGPTKLEDRDRLKMSHNEPKYTPAYVTKRKKRNAFKKIETEFFLQDQKTGPRRKRRADSSSILVCFYENKDASLGKTADCHSQTKYCKQIQIDIVPC